MIILSLNRDKNVLIKSLFLGSNARLFENYSNIALTFSIIKKVDFIFFVKNVGRVLQ